jgi:AcrR family transcriptional regulator
LTNKRLFDSIWQMPANAAATIAPTTRDALLDAAEQHFAARGFAGASMRDIAAEAGLKNQASVYHYFAGKEQLYDAVIARAVSEILPAYAGSTNGAHGASLDRLIDYLAARPQVAGLIERAGLEDDRAVQAIVRRRLRPLFDAGVALLREADGTWDATDLPHLAAGLYHLVFGYFASASLLRAVMRDDPRSAAMLDRERRFLNIAVARLLGTQMAAEPISPNPRWRKRP